MRLTFSAHESYGKLCPGLVLKTKSSHRDYLKSLVSSVSGGDQVAFSCSVLCNPRIAAKFGPSF